VKSAGVDSPIHQLARMGRVFFAIGFIGLGVDHFIFGDFVTGRPPAWPESVPGRLVWAYLTGALLVGTGIAVLVRTYARLAAHVAAALIFLWALLRHIPVVLGSELLSPDWTTAGKALSFIGGSLAVAATFPTIRSNSSIVALVNRGRELVVAGRVCLGLYLILTGIQHYLFTELVASLVPPWFPGSAVFWAYFTGVALIAGGIGLLIPPTARLAALLSGSMILSWFFLVHVSREIAGIADGIAVFEALAMSGILFVIAGSRADTSPAEPLTREPVAP
jgi:uncharacterized membrane protein